MPQYVQIALAGGSALAGALGNRASARTSTQQQQSQQQQQSSASSTSTGSQSDRRALSPEQIAAMSRLGTFSESLMNDPMAGLEAIRSGALNRVNANYGGAIDAIKAKLLANGAGGSGKFNRAVRGTELSRIGDLSGLEANFANLASQRQIQGAGLAQGLLGVNLGSDSTSTTTQAANTSSSGSSSSSGTGVAPGNAAAGGLGAGLDVLGFLLGQNTRLRAARQPGLGGIFGR